MKTDTKQPSKDSEDILEDAKDSTDKKETSTIVFNTTNIKTTTIAANPKGMKTIETEFSVTSSPLLEPNLIQNHTTPSKDGEIKSETTRVQDDRTLTKLFRSPKIKLSLQTTSAPLYSTPTLCQPKLEKICRTSPQKECVFKWKKSCDLRRKCTKIPRNICEEVLKTVCKYATIKCK